MKISNETWVPACSYNFLIGVCSLSCWTLGFSIQLLSQHWHSHRTSIRISVFTSSKQSESLCAASLLPLQSLHLFNRHHCYSCSRQEPSLILDLCFPQTPEQQFYRHCLQYPKFWPLLTISRDKTLVWVILTTCLPPSLSPTWLAVSSTSLLPFPHANRAPVCYSVWNCVWLRTWLHFPVSPEAVLAM